MLPRTRLLFWTAIVVLPCAALAPLGGALSVASLAMLGLFFALALGDALAAPRRWQGLQLELPPVLRWQKDRPAVLPVTIRRAPGPEWQLRLGIALPESFRPPLAECLAVIPAGLAEARVECPSQAGLRGRFVIDRIHVETASPLGFWALRTSRPVACEVRVYPNLFEQRRQVSALFLRRSQAGTRAQRQAGQGREFEKLRGYIPGDSLSDIHWKASAKRGEGVTKVYQVERTHEVYVAVDASRLSARVPETPAAGQSGVPALERYVSAALILALAAEQQGDQFGLITFSDRVLGFVRAKQGQAHYEACRDRLYTLQPQPVSPDFEELCTFVRLRLRKRALLIVLTALDDPVLAESFTKASELICRQHLVLVNVLRPAEVQPLFSEGPEVTQLDEIYRRLAGHLQFQKMRELQKLLQRRGIRLALLDPGRVTAEVIAQHAEVKARQLI